MADDNTEGERLPQSMSESVLCLLCFDQDAGAVAAGMVKPADFTRPYDEIVKRVLDYRETYKEPPGTSHIDDIFADIFSNPKDERRDEFMDILRKLLNMLKQGYNPEFILGNITDFVRTQHYIRLWSSQIDVLRSGFGAADRFEAKVVEALRFQPQALDMGTALNESAALDFLDPDEGDRVKLGIEPFDDLEICPTRQELFGYMGPRGSGKSMFCTHVTVMALLQHMRVLDCTLELSVKHKMQRVLQSLFAIAKRRERVSETRFVRDALERVIGFEVGEVLPPHALTDPDIAEFLMRKQQENFDEYEQFRVKRFATGRLDINHLRSYLDLLDMRAHWQPDVLIVDYPGIMSINPEFARFELSKIFVDLRGLGVERNMAVVVPHQANRSGERSNTLRSWHSSETMGLFDVADIVVTYSATEEEKEYHLARLFAAKVRNDRDKMTVLISQAYEYSQFVTGAAYRPQDYWDYFKALVGREVEQDDDGV